MRLVAAAGVVLLLASARDVPMSHAQPSSTLDWPVPAIDVACEPGTECLWWVASQFDLPVGLQDGELPSSGPVPADTPRFRVPATTVRELLTQFVRTKPQYEWREVGGIGVVRPVASWKDDKDGLNQSAEPFDFPDATFDEAVSHLGKIGRFWGLASDQREKRAPAGCAIHFGGGSVLEAITAVAQAFGHAAWKVDPVRSQSAQQVSGQTVSTDDRLQSLSVHRPRRR